MKIKPDLPLDITLPVLRIGSDGLDWADQASGDMLGLSEDPIARAEGPVDVELHAEHVGAEILVQCAISAPIRLQCSRCACFFSTIARVPAFLRAYESAKHPEVLDLTADIREDILLEIPGFPLCRPDCKGLCARCGTDLNEGSCACVPEKEPDAWSVLDRLVLPDQTENDNNGASK